MARYQVAIVQRPQGWNPAVLDDVPPEPAELLELAGSHDELFAGVRAAIHYNEHADRHRDNRWAVVIEAGAVGRRFPQGRLCTPITYRLTAIWRPDGWEPGSPLDVPKCLWQNHADSDTQSLSYQQAVDTMRGLNSQSMDLAGEKWWVVMAVESEPISRTISYASSGTDSYTSSGTETVVQVRRMHVARPEHSGHGDCTHCPAHTMQCALEEQEDAPKGTVAADKLHPATR